MPDITIDHLPVCSTSRKVLATIRSSGVKSAADEYRKPPASAR